MKNKQDIDFEWFLSNYDDLYKRYGTAYLVIKNKTVLGAFPSCVAGVNAMKGKEKPGTFIVQRCDGTEEAHTGYIASMNFA